MTQDRLQVPCHTALIGAGRAWLLVMLRGIISRLSTGGTTAPLLLALAALAAACSPTAPAEDDALPPRVEPSRCVLPEHGAEPPLARAIAIGEGEGAQFVAYAEGSELPLVLGWQGGYMITPRVRVEALAGDDALEPCWQLRLTNEVDGAWAGPGMVAHLAFAREGGAFYSDPVNNLLTDAWEELSDKPLRLDFEVRGEGVDEASSVTVLLRPPEE